MRAVVFGILQKVSRVAARSWAGTGHVAMPQSCIYAITKMCIHKESKHVYTSRFCVYAIPKMCIHKKCTHLHFAFVIFFFDYPIIPYHTIPYHTIPYHTIPYHIAWVCRRKGTRRRSTTTLQHTQSRSRSRSQSRPRCSMSISTTGSQRRSCHRAALP